MNEMIDNVDVSECEFYDNYECNCHISECWEPEDRSKMLCRQVDDCYYKQLQRTKQELQKFQDMAKKGLEEFKDVGGCWGCGLQLQLNQDIEDIKQLKAENERLKEEIDFLKKELECSKKLRKRMQNDLLKSDRINDKLKAENEIILNRLTQYEEDADVQVCLFSDLKRLEQENAELKGTIDVYKMSENEANEIIAELKYALKLQEQENVRLREKFNNLISTPIYENCNLLLEQKRRLEKYLQKIKTIAERQLLVTNVGTYQMVYYADFSEYRNEILDLINKAEEE